MKEEKRKEGEGGWRREKKRRAWEEEGGERWEEEEGEERWEEEMGGGDGRREKIHTKRRREEGRKMGRGGGRRGEEEGEWDEGGKRIGREGKRRMRGQEAAQLDCAEALMTHILTCNHLCQDAPQRPHVHTLRVALGPQQDLWGTVPACGNIVRHGWVEGVLAVIALDSGEGTSQSKICQL